MVDLERLTQDGAHLEKLAGARAQPRHPAVHDATQPSWQFTGHQLSAALVDLNAPLLLQPGQQLN